MEYFVRKIRVYDEEFKLNAIRLYLDSGDSYKTVAKKLDIPHRTLGTWVENYRRNNDFSKDNLKLSDQDILALKRELQIVKEERDILKKALGVFSLHQK